MGAAEGRCCAHDADAPTEAPDVDIWAREVSSGALAPRPRVDDAGGAADASPSSEVAVRALLRMVTKGDDCLDCPQIEAFVRRVTVEDDQVSLRSSMRSCDVEEEEEDEEIDPTAAFGNHCYFYNLQIRGRHPRCTYKAGECGQSHERIPDHIFENFSIPSLHGAGSDASLRKIFAEVNSTGSGGFSKKEMQSFSASRGMRLEGGQLGTVFKLLDHESTNLAISLEEFCLMGRLSLQWYTTMSSAVSANTDPKQLRRKLQKIFRMAPIQQQASRRVIEPAGLWKIFQRADVQVERQTVARMVASVGRAPSDLGEAEVQDLLEALCVIAGLASPVPDEDAGDLRRRVRRTTRTSVAEAFLQGGRNVRFASVSTSEDFKALLQKYGLPVDEDRLDKVIAMFDEDGSGALEELEMQQLLDMSMKWHNFMQKLAKEGAVVTGNLSEAALRRKFILMDKDTSGTIDMSELAKCFGGMGMDLDADTLRKVAVLADSDGNEEIGWPEFKRMFQIICGATS